MAARIPFWVVLFSLTVMATTMADEEKPRCPPGSLNEGWIVDKGHAFSDPLDCCGHRVSQWHAFEEYEAPYAETGCRLSTRILGVELSRFISPVTCDNNSTCGDQDFVGNRMQCCSGNQSHPSYCAAVHASGESRCEKVAELIQWSNEDAQDEASAKEFSAFASRCYSEKDENAVCVTCSASCTDGSVKFLKSSPKDNAVPVEERIKISNV